MKRTLIVALLVSLVLVSTGPLASNISPIGVCTNLADAKSMALAIFDMDIPKYKLLMKKGTCFHVQGETFNAKIFTTEEIEISEDGKKVIFQKVLIEGGKRHAYAWHVKF